MRGHDLTASDVTVFVGAVVGDRIVHRADVIPQQQRIFVPEVGVKILVLHLQFTKIVNNLSTLLLAEFVDFHGIAGVGVQHFFLRDRVS